MSEAMEDRVATELTEGATPEQRTALAAWASRLLAIRDDSEDGFGKARSALMATVGGATAMIALFGGGLAVLTVLGAAAGAPLWIVFGSGDGLARKIVAAAA